MWHQGGRLLRISVRSWRRARSDYHLQRWVPWRTERWTEVVHLTACPMSHICGICVMHQCHVQHAKFMPGHVGFVFFPNKIETKHDDSTTIKKKSTVPSALRPFGLVLFLVKNPSACHLAAIQQSRQLNGAQPNSYVAFQQFCYSHAVNLLAASHASVVEQCGDGVAGSQTVSYILQPICEFSPWAGLVRAR